MSELQVAIVLYDRMTALDAVGPMDVLRFLPGARVELVSERPGPVRTDSGVLELVATTSYDDSTPPDVVVVPGGPGTAEALGSPLIPWLQQVHPDHDVDDVGLLGLDAAGARGTAARSPRRLALRGPRPAPPARRGTAPTSAWSSTRSTTS